MVIFENRSGVNFWVHEHRIVEKRHLQAVMARIPTEPGFHAQKWSVAYGNFGR